MVLRYQNLFGFSWLDASLWRFSCVVCSWLGFISQFQIKKKQAMPIYRRIYLSSNWLIEIYHETNFNILWPSTYLSKVVGVDTQGRALNSHESSSFSFPVDSYSVNTQKWNSNNKDCKKETIETLMWLYWGDLVKLASWGRLFCNDALVNFYSLPLGPPGSLRPTKSNKQSLHV